MILVALTACRSGDKKESDETTQAAAVPAASDQARVASSWAPKGPYWSEYRAVFLQVACDSAGAVVAADTMFSYATPAETDSILDAVWGIHFDSQEFSGKMWWTAREAPSDTLIHYIIPFVTRDEEIDAPPPPVSRRELEAAGLGPWLSIWEDLLPGWPFETWPHRWTSSLYEPPESTVVDDRELVARNMVSVSPDSAWRVHPFLGLEITPGGRMLRDVDSGYAIYRSGRTPQRVCQQVTGTPVGYDSAEWIDSQRFVVTGTSEVDVGYGRKTVMYRAPMLILGRVDSLGVTGILGPPVPAGKEATMWNRVNEYRRWRYPEVWKAEHGPR